MRVGNTLVALEAAHIKWHQAGGPDSELGVSQAWLSRKLGISQTAEALR